MIGFLKIRSNCLVGTNMMSSATYYLFVISEIITIKNKFQIFSIQIVITFQKISSCLFKLLMLLTSQTQDVIQPS